eukprot:TRINITY_DN25464_c0_g1_i1.p1 TRINITY_DN25464_c0_g1~~TRINITY_DN25464_c0_g1_i1.p1  ORF type:complete len:473 (-),score=75.91 TRINITY_DN25464_c0_g1_i1:108-1526(-)
MSNQVLEGWLTKRGGQIKTWKKRWCVLKDGSLHYYKSKGGELQGSFKVGSVSAVNIDNTKKKKFCFEVCTPERNYYLFADTESSMKEWITAIGGKNASANPATVATKKTGSPTMPSPSARDDDSDSDDSSFGPNKDGSGLGPRVAEKDFTKIKVIGRGNFGKVFVVKKNDNGKIFAMKVLTKKSIIEKNELEHTKTERSILMRLDHPFLVHLYYSFQSSDKLYFIMDYVNGGELFFHLQKEKKFTPERVKFYCAEIVLGLEHLHKQGVVYRDLKPENILLTADGHICMTDFGISKEGLNAKDDKTATFCGTPEYLAPEVLEGKDYGKEVDWWSFGTLMFEMLTGLPPFYNEDVQTMYSQIINDTLNFPKTMAPDARSLLLGLLERDPKKRLSDPTKIRSHPYFESINWDDLYGKKVKPPFIPPVKSGADYSQFDTTFTSEEPTMTYVESSHLAPGDQSNFQGFTFVAPSNIK